MILADAAFLFQFRIIISKSYINITNYGLWRITQFLWTHTHKLFNPKFSTEAFSNKKWSPNQFQQMPACAQFTHTTILAEASLPNFQMAHNSIPANAG